MYMGIKLLQKLLRICARVSAVLLLGLYVYGTPLPQKSAILPEVALGEPIQQNILEQKPLEKSYGEFDYTLTPRANYELPGLVVAHHHSDSWIDISHENDPAQSVDVCVVWGKNISTNAYREVSYSHGDWTCYYSWDTEIAPAFSGSHLSNSHLIPHNKEEARLIKSINVGDQILLSGILTDYSIVGKDGALLGKRQTSLTRTDAGNGACEVLYLSKVTILQRNMPWREPLIAVLYILLVLWIPVEIYCGIPRYPRRAETLTGKPHVANPYDIKKFLPKK